MPLNNNNTIAKNLHLNPNIVIQDSSAMSHDYFNITEFPGYFKLGSNIIKMAPNVNGLQFGTAVEFDEDKMQYYYFNNVIYTNFDLLAYNNMNIRYNKMCDSVSILIDLYNDAKVDEYFLDLIFKKLKNYKAKEIFLEKEDLKKFIFSLLKENRIKREI